MRVVGTLSGLLPLLPQFLAKRGAASAAYTYGNYYNACMTPYAVTATIMVTIAYCSSRTDTKRRTGHTCSQIVRPACVPQVRLQQHVTVVTYYRSAPKYALARRSWSVSEHFTGSTCDSPCRVREKDPYEGFIVRNGVDKF